MRIYKEKTYLILKDVPIARTGFQEYKESELFGEGDEELDVERRGEDVFDEGSIKSFEGKPLTIEHPENDVTDENRERLQVGRVENVRREGDNLVADIVVTDPEAASLIESGEMGDLSCGYDCEIREDGRGLYMANIKGNHVALCEEGRAGNTKIADSKIQVTDNFKKLCR